MKRLIPIALLVPSVASAEVTAEVRAGAGGDASAAAYSSLDAAVVARGEDAVVPLALRGLTMGDVDGTTGRFWAFTGLDPDDRDGGGVEATASGRQALDGSDRRGFMTARAWLRGAGWQASARAAYQPVGDLRDGYWRSGRGVLASGGAIEVPPMWAIGDRDHQLTTGVVTVDLGHRTALADGTNLGWDREVDYAGIRWQAPRYLIDAIHVHYVEFGHEDAASGATSTGTSATRFEIDVARTAIRLGADGELRLHAGLGFVQPFAPYTLVGTSETTSGPLVTSPGYGVDLKAGAITVGAGSWARLDRSGHAADVGQLATGSVDGAIGEVKLRGTIEGGRLVREAIGAGAPMGLSPVGTVFWMGRAELAASLALPHELTLTGGAWAERSDRDDPRWAAAASGAVASHVGGELALGRRFR